MYISIYHKRYPFILMYVLLRINWHISKFCFVMIYSSKNSTLFVIGIPRDRVNLDAALKYVYSYIFIKSVKSSATYWLEIIFYTCQIFHSIFIEITNINLKIFSSNWKSFLLVLKLSTNSSLRLPRLQLAK